MPPKLFVNLCVLSIVVPYIHEATQNLIISFSSGYEHLLRTESI